MNRILWTQYVYYSEAVCYYINANVMTCFSFEYHLIAVGLIHPSMISVHQSIHYLFIFNLEPRGSAKACPSHLWVKGRGAHWTGSGGIKLFNPLY